MGWASPGSCEHLTYVSVIERENVIVITAGLQACLSVSSECRSCNGSHQTVNGQWLYTVMVRASTVGTKRATNVKVNISEALESR